MLALFLTGIVSGNVVFGAGAALVSAGLAFMYFDRPLPAGVTRDPGPGA